MSKAEVLEKSGESFQIKPLRLWPGMIIVALQWLVRFVIPAIVPNGMIIGVMGYSFKFYYSALFLFCNYYILNL